MVSGDQLFQQFLRERTYLKNVTPKTREWYESAWKALKSTQGDGEAWPLTKPLLQTFIVRLRERGVRPVSCNTWLKALNAFAAWLYEQGHLAQPVALASLRVEKRIIPTLDDAVISRLLAFKPRTFAEWRIYTLDCTILDTGCRIQELLSARVQDFDLDSEQTGNLQRRARSTPRTGHERAGPGGGTACSSGRSPSRSHSRHRYHRDKSGNSKARGKSRVASRQFRYGLPWDGRNEPITCLLPR